MHTNGATDFVIILVGLEGALIDGGYNSIQGIHFEATNLRVAHNNSENIIIQSGDDVGRANSAA